MRYVHLRAFHHVCIHQGFSRAAAALCVSQPVLSEQVRKLENEYDVRLFDRRGKTITPTDAGRQLFEITRSYFEAETRAREFLSRHRALNAGTLRIGADNIDHLVDILRVFREQYPAIGVKVETGNSAFVIDRLQSRQVDVGCLCDSPIFAGDDYRRLLLNRSELVGFVNRSHPLARQSAVDLAELARHTVILREIGSRTRAMFEELALSREVEIPVSIEAQGREAVQTLVERGIGVGVIASKELHDDPRIVIVAIEDSDLELRECLICLSSRSKQKMIAAFFGVARQLLADT